MGNIISSVGEVQVPDRLGTVRGTYPGQFPTPGEITPGAVDLTRHGRGLLTSQWSGVGSYGGNVIKGGLE